MDTLDVKLNQAQEVKALIYQMRTDIGLSTAIKSIRDKSECYNLTSSYKQKEKILVFGWKGTVYLLFGKAKHGTQMNYLIELDDNSESCSWDMTQEEIKRYGCNPLKRYRITLESMLTKF